MRSVRYRRSMAGDLISMMLMCGGFWARLGDGESLVSGSDRIAVITGVNLISDLIRVGVSGGCWGRIRGAVAGCGA
jgi:hypothetical protein